MSTQMKRTQEHPVSVRQPLVDIFENDEGLLLRADLPGVRPEDLKVELDEGRLSLGGRRWIGPPATEETEGRRFVEYLRQFRVSDEIDAEQISARFELGVLQLSLPKKAAQKPRKIEVQVG